VRIARSLRMFLNHQEGLRVLIFGENRVVNGVLKVLITIVLSAIFASPAVANCGSAEAQVILDYQRDSVANAFERQGCPDSYLDIYLASSLEAQRLERERRINLILRPFDQEVRLTLIQSQAMTQISNIGYYVALIAGFYAGIVFLIALLRRVLWIFSGLFFLIDELMWFLYNPLRSFMKDVGGQRSRLAFHFFSFLLIKPAWQISIWAITSPLRILTAIYFDVIMYLFVMITDSVDELLHPQLGKMRHRRGFDYAWRWVVGLPKRLIWLIVKNVLAVIDSAMMFIVSAVWPTFTMYHGTPRDAAFDISSKGRWFVGTGNYGGSGVYFGRSLRVARHYAGSRSSKVADQRVIVARVTFTMLRNCSTLPLEARQDVGRMGESGINLAKSLSFPYYATELWRDGKKWWEYCILFGDKAGQFVSSWRIRPIGFVYLEGQSHITGTLERLWGGKSHYCLSFKNTGVTVASAAFLIWVAAYLVSAL
jgi:hypothetical protein